MKKERSVGSEAQKGNGDHQKGEMVPLGDREKADQGDFQNRGRRGGEKNARKNACRNHRHSLGPRSLKKFSRKKHPEQQSWREKDFSKRSRRDYNINIRGIQKKRHFRCTHSVTGGAASFVVGLGVRAVRAGSIGRDRQRPGENTHSPQGEAGGLGPRLVHEETSASWFQADRPDPQAGASLSRYNGLLFIAIRHP